MAKKSGEKDSQAHCSQRHQRRIKKLLRTLDRRFETYFSQVAIPQLYVESREKVVTELKNVGNYATTTDMWSSRTTEPYLSLCIL